MDYRYKKNSKKFSWSFFIVAILIFVIIMSIAFLFVYYIQKNKEIVKQKNEIRENYKKLFEQKNYTLIIEKMDLELKKDPFFVDYLLLRGYSYFFLGEGEKILRKRNSFFLSSLVDLRKSLAVGVSNKNKSNVYLILGKIYYYLGENYYYQSINYLTKSLKSGTIRKDLFYILGLVYSNIGNYEKSIEFFKESLKLEESDFLLLAIGLTYYKKNEIESAIKFLDRVIKTSNNPKIVEKSCFTLGEIYFNQDNLNDSLKYFDKVIGLNENNSSAHYYRGEIHFKRGDKIKARAEWRKTLLIDPGHVRALKRIY